MTAVEAERQVKGVVKPQALVERDADCRGEGLHVLGGLIGGLDKEPVAEQVGAEADLVIVPGALAAVERVDEVRMEDGLAEAVIDAAVTQVGYRGDVLAVGSQMGLAPESDTADVITSVDGAEFRADDKAGAVVGQSLLVGGMLGHDAVEPVVPMVEAAVYAAGEMPVPRNGDEDAKVDLSVQVTVQAAAAIGDLSVERDLRDGAAAKIEAVGLRMVGHARKPLFGGETSGKKDVFVRRWKVLRLQDAQRLTGWDLGAECRQRGDSGQDGREDERQPDRAG